MGLNGAGGWTTPGPASTEASEARSVLRASPAGGGVRVGFNEAGGPHSEPESLTASRAGKLEGRVIGLSTVVEWDARRSSPGTSMVGYPSDSPDRFQGSSEGRSPTERRVRPASRSLRASTTGVFPGRSASLWVLLRITDCLHGCMTDCRPARAVRSPKTGELRVRYL